MNTWGKVSIEEFGAKGDGKHINTEAIQKAIDVCEGNGGGTVVIPSGIFVSGTICMKSNITLQLNQGAELRASGNIEDYCDFGFHHNEFSETLSFIYSIGQSNIRITGEGKIDLNDGAFVEFNRLKPFEIPESKLNEEQRREAVVETLPRPAQPIFLHNCTDLKFDRITIANSPCWTITFSNCRNVKVNMISIYNHLQVPNNDGIHFCSCSDVIVTDCVLSCGDDCIAVTGITNWAGISERVIISDCILRSRSAAVRVGHAASKIRNVVISNLVIYGTNRGIAIFAGDSGFVENVTASNLIMDTAIYAGAWWGKGEPLVICSADSNGSIKNVSVTNVKTTSENGIVIVGQDGNIRGVTLNNWEIVLLHGKNRSLIYKKLDLQPARMRTVPEGKIPWIYADDVAGLQLHNIQYGPECGEIESFETKAVINNVDELEQAGVKLSLILNMKGEANEEH